MDNEFKFLLYKAEQEDVSVDALVRDETIWLTQKAMAELFGIDKSGISRHLKNIFESGELEEEVVVAKIAIPTRHGAIPNKEQNSPTNYYNLDAIISVGYRVDSIRATHFRKWATGVLKEYMVKGFTLDDERLKGNVGGSYWKELLARIRDIRSSEKMLYRQVLDLYATSLDYDPSCITLRCRILYGKSSGWIRRSMTGGSCLT